MAFTQDDLNNVERAIVSGSLSVSYDGKSRTFRSLNDLLLIRNIIQNALGMNPGRSNTVLVAHNSGRPPLYTADAGIMPYYGGED
jgi:hypothetical protein